MHSEWDYRAPTLAEQVDDLKANWHGPRCPHGMPLNAPGPDLICNSCEAEMAAEEEMAQLRDQIERTGRYPFPIGPCRAGTKDSEILLGFRDRPKSLCVNCAQPVHGFVHVAGHVVCDPDDLAEQGLSADEGYQACPTPPNDDLPHGKRKCVNCHRPIEGFVHLTGNVDCDPEDILARGLYPDEGIHRAWPTPPTADDLPF